MKSWAARKEGWCKLHLKPLLFFLSLLNLILPLPCVFFFFSLPLMLIILLEFYTDKPSLALLQPPITATFNCQHYYDAKKTRFPVLIFHSLLATWLNHDVNSWNVWNCCYQIWYVFENSWQKEGITYFSSSAHSNLLTCECEYSYHIIIWS